MAQDHNVREATGAYRAQVRPAQPQGAVEGCAADRVRRLHTVADQPAHNITDAPFLHQQVGRYIVGADA